MKTYSIKLQADNDPKPTIFITEAELIEEALDNLSAFYFGQQFEIISIKED